MIAQITTLGQTQIGKIPANPYFERNNFVKEQVSEKELSSIHNLGLEKITIEDLVETKTAFNIIGYDPATKLINLMMDNDVLALARTGLNYHPHLGFIASLLPRLKKEGGATHLALCLPRCLQRLLDAFVITGEIVPNLSPIDLSVYGLNESNDFVALLQAARLSGYQITAVEPDNAGIAFDPGHEQQIAKHILTILTGKTKPKVIFIAPDRHLSRLPIGDWLPVANILKETGVNIFTVTQYWHSDFMPKILGYLLTGLSRPFAIATKDSKMFKALQSRVLPIEYIVPIHWDLTIIYPRSSTSQNKLKYTLLKVSAAVSRTFAFGRIGA
jgi:hypothetical protein